MFGVDVANITRMLIVYTQGVVGFGIADQARLPWKYFEDFSNRVIKMSISPDSLTKLGSQGPCSAQSVAPALQHFILVWSRGT
jgi:hypothetical protein